MWLHCREMRLPNHIIFLSFPKNEKCSYIYCGLFGYRLNCDCWPDQATFFDSEWQTSRCTSKVNQACLTHQLAILPHLVAIYSDAGASYCGQMEAHLTSPNPIIPHTWTMHTWQQHDSSKEARIPIQAVSHRFRRMYLNLVSALPS